MDEPILEALTFSLESDLRVSREENFVPAGNSGTSQFRGNRNPSIVQLTQSVFNKNIETPFPFPGCDVKFSSVNCTEHRGDILKHFLIVHNFVIDDVDHVANLHRYLLHWKERFTNVPIDDLCTSFWMVASMTPEEKLTVKLNDSNEVTTTDQERVKYFMISDILPEDKQLRIKLWNERLETVLEVNRLEREQTDFAQQCLFCKAILTGNRSYLFNHMDKEHCFHMGQPDNLVFVDELMIHLTNTLNKMNCIYCGKTFKDKVVMREHMRKKLHKKINPENPDYDRFYIINYLEPGKDWKRLNEEEPEDERAEEDWLEKEESTSIVCLLCPFQSTKFETLLSHMKTDHHFDYEATVAACDFYQKVKIVNFIRRNVHQNLCFFCNMKFLEKVSLLEHVHRHLEMGTEFPPPETWNQAEHFFPTYENDQFLILLDDNNMEEEGVDSDHSDTNVIPEDMSCSQFSDA